MKNLIEKSISLTNYLDELILSELANEIVIITPSKPNNRGCQLSLRLIKPFDNITDRLNSVGIITDWREPDIIRIAPVPLYNTFLDCFEFVHRLKILINE
jgi:kynureninase